MERVVIVGAGLAGHRAAVALHRAQFDGTVVIVGDEHHRPYDRPPLSKQLLIGAMDYQECYYPCEDLNVTWMLGIAAAGLDAGRQVIQLSDGAELPYGRLLIATGRRARGWPEPLVLEGIVTLRGLDDARTLRDAIAPHKRIVIVGAGFIGCEVAATLRTRGVDEVTMVDIAPHPMPALGPELGTRAAALHERHGVRLRMASSVEAFEGSGRVRAVRLASGERLDADLVLLALGSAPNSEWLEGSGIELLHGNVLCDEHCMVIGAENIAAAGDIAAFPHPSVGQPMWFEHWSNAREMGALAATNLFRDADKRQLFAPVPTFWSDQYDVKIKSAGLLTIADSCEVIEDDPERPAVIAEARRDGKLVGAVTFNRNRAVVDYQRRLGEQLSAALA